ncbi:MAG: polysaccharide pyruvyl transferase family protein, partial [Alphaproteobacteria bacterium]|nr:polysaccharide pyruvyl transferase family protein [Alphaproteobacteria bacterium]
DSIQLEASKQCTLKSVFYNMMTKIPAIHQKDYTEKKLKFLNFAENNLKINREKDSKVFIAGSDQIWNPIVFNPDFYLQFVDGNSVKASYAASIGVSKIGSDNYAEYQRLLSGFDAISVREIDAWRELKAVMGVSCDIRVDMDPTFLLTKEEWTRKSFESKIKVDGDYVVLYILHIPRNIKSICKWVKEIYHAKLVLIDASGKITMFVPHDIVIRNVGPCDFLALFRDSKAVITTSFHGTAFSILFQKDFYSIVNPNFPSRISNLLTSLELPMIGDVDVEFSKNDVSYDFVQSVLNKNRENAKKYFEDLMSYYEKHKIK